MVAQSIDLGDYNCRMAESRKRRRDLGLVCKVKIPRFLATVATQHPRNPKFCVRLPLSSEAELEYGASILNLRK
jgi:hypothetical protein